MRDIRVSVLLAVALFVWGCAQGSADYTTASSRQGVNSPDPTPEVVRTRRDAGAETADAAVVYDDQDDEPVVPDDELDFEPEPELEAFPVDPLPITDAAVIDPVTDAALPAPPLTSAPTPTPCVAGAYVGTFRGELLALNGVIRIDVVGTLRFELPAAEAQRLTLSAGTLEGTDADGHPVKATIAGSIACDTGALLEGKISAGTYTRPDPVFRNVNTTARFSGALTGSFAPGDRPSGKGTWAVDSERTTRSGSGSFEVQLAK